MEHAIKTERLDLRPLQASDFDFMQALAARPESYQYERDNARPREEVAEQVSRCLERAKLLPKEGVAQWIIIENKTRMGEVHVACNWEETLEWEIGWYLMAEYWGKGFAAEAVKAVIHYAFAHFHINRLAAFLNTENVRSVALAERAGMYREGWLREVRIINGVYYDEYVYSLLKREYLG